MAGHLPPWARGTCRCPSQTGSPLKRLSLMFLKKKIVSGQILRILLTAIIEAQSRKSGLRGQTLDIEACLCISTPFLSKAWIFAKLSMAHGSFYCNELWPVTISHLRTPVENMARACCTVQTRIGARPGSRLEPDSTKMFTMYDVITLIPAHWVIIIRAPILRVTFKW